MANQRFSAAEVIEALDKHKGMVYLAAEALGRPLIILPYDRPGCWDRIQAFLLTWARRLLWVGVLLGVVFE